MADRASDRHTDIQTDRETIFGTVQTPQSLFSLQSHALALCLQSHALALCLQSHAPRAVAAPEGNLNFSDYDSGDRFNRHIKQDSIHFLLDG